MLEGCECLQTLFLKNDFRFFGCFHPWIGAPIQAPGTYFNNVLKQRNSYRRACQLQPASTCHGLREMEHDKTALYLLSERNNRDMKASSPDYKLPGYRQIFASAVFAKKTCSDRDKGDLSATQSCVLSSATIARHNRPPRPRHPSLHTRRRDGVPAASRDNTIKGLASPASPRPTGLHMHPWFSILLFPRPGCAHTRIHV